MTNAVAASAVTALILIACSGDLHEYAPPSSETESTRTTSETTEATLRFDTEIQADIDTFACSTAGCHGSGIGGFALTAAATGDALSANYEAFKLRAVDDERSKVLLKATNAEAHVGGTRFTKESATYTRWLTWIRQGSPR